MNSSEDIKKHLDKLFNQPSQIIVQYFLEKGELNNIFNKSLDEVIYHKMSKIFQLLGNSISGIKNENSLFTPERFPLSYSSTQAHSEDLVVLAPSHPHK